MTILNTNLAFGGRRTYVLKYLAQCAVCGRINKSVGGSNTFKYKPVSNGDMALAVATAFEKIEQTKGKRYMVNGKDEATLKQLLNMFEKVGSKAENSTQLISNMGISDIFEEFFCGVAHDKNMAHLAEFMEANKPNLEEGCPDFHKTFGLKYDWTLKDYFAQEKLKPEDVLYPLFTNYKMTCLD